MFFSISSLWNAISSFASNLGVSEPIITKAKQDFNKLLDRYHRTRGFVMEKYKSRWNTSLSIQKFFPWWANLLCFFELELSGFRHAALRELRSYLEAGERSYYIDSRHHEKSYEDKVKILSNQPTNWLNLPHYYPTVTPLLPHNYPVILEQNFLGE